MEDALKQSIGRGVVALPMHDALLYREEDAQDAKQSILDAFQRRVGARKPRVRIKSASSESLEAPVATSEKAS